MSLLEMLRSARATWYSWRSQKRYYREGVLGMKYSGYEAGAKAKGDALIKRVNKLKAKVQARWDTQDVEGMIAARNKLARAEADLDAYIISEATRKAQARKRA